jgi:hypothetical protein
MQRKMILAGLFVALACGLVVFARYSLEAIFVGGFCPTHESDLLGDNVIPIVIGSAAFAGVLAAGFRTFILFGSNTPKQLASAWWEMGAALRRSGFSESRRKAAPTVWR